MSIYLDHNATTPVEKEVLEAMLPWFSVNFGNAASSTHAYGWAAAEAVKIAREEVAKAIGAQTEEIIFTSGATESINLALKGVAELYASKGDHIITVATEHKAVLDTCEHLQKTGKRLTVLPVDTCGRIDLSALKSALTEKTLLVSVMYANNETGVIHPIREIADVVHEAGAFLFCDATQAIGKVAVDVEEEGIDLLALSGHKIYGPKGIGALYLKKRNPRVAVAAQIHGGGHERGFRSGTLNVPGIIGMGKAISLAKTRLEADFRKISALRDKLEAGLLEIEETHINGLGPLRLPNTSNISFHYTDGEALVKTLKDLAVSTGSACTSAKMEPSHVLKAMGIPDNFAYSSIRFSLGRSTTESQIDHAIAHVREGIDRLRSESPVWQMRAK